MIGNSLIIQIGVAGIAIAIIVTYIKPSITEVGILQDQISQTLKELDKVKSVNQKLTDLVNQADAISPKDKQALSSYLPVSFDEVVVMKDLEAITKEAGIKLASLSYQGGSLVASTESEVSEVSTENPIGHKFSLKISSSYEQLKFILLLLERNKYPLDIQTLTITPTDGGLLNVSLEVMTYSFK